jgi:hypothetical protein
MSIFVIDQGPELFWFVSQALIEDELPIKHIQTADTGEQHILQELPRVVILNGDNSAIVPDKFISRMRNHVFARNTMFIVVTADTSESFKRTLLVSGAAQILYRGPGFSPSPKFFATIIKWCNDFKNPNPALFDFRPSPFHSEAEFTSYGRVGWISEDQCMVESNIDLLPGQSIAIHNPVFDELEMKGVTLECIEKNTVGRYYQYANSLLCKIVMKDPEHDHKKLDAWIKNNLDISKHKPIKLVYFEDDPDYREVIKQMIKANKRYCARGYGSLDDLTEILDYQMPHLVLINRKMVVQDKAKFEKIRDFLKGHFCYCITYSNGDWHDAESFKEMFDFAMHTPSTVDLPLLESMILKLEEKLPQELKTHDKKVYPSKHSVFSRISFHSHAKLTEIAINGAGVILPHGVSNFCACEISSPSFGIAGVSQTQYFRCFGSQATPNGIFHRMIFMGQNLKDNKLFKEAIEKIDLVGYERWLRGDVEPD